MTEPHAVVEHHHRDVQGGAARAAVFGVSDGLVSNVSLILGVAGASPAPGIVRLAGLAGLVAGAFSMASGEFVSMKAQTELLQRELALEEREIERHPEAERRELAAIYRQRGVAPEMADDLASAMHRDPQTALETHAREELGIDPNKLGSPQQAAISSFLAFCVGAMVPLLPWFFASGNGAVVASIILGAASALVIGAALARFTGRSTLRSALRQLGIAALAAGVTYAVGRAVGVKSAT
ncbi:MAG TPA: VIT1/CCC1 transporter family protein [Acidimicrobiales bacterium]|nr:VIT1/CCC1 transporter family protein [Acidimicrobiales bacterium]